MTGVLRTLGMDGQTPSMWSAVIQQINGVANVAAGAATNQAKFTLDAYQNCTYIQGALDQVVTIGSGGSYEGPVFNGQPGVLVRTGLMGFGAAIPSGFVHTTVTTIAESAVANVASGTGLVNGYVCGAATVNGTPAIAAGTTYTISGLTLTLSQPAAETITNGYFCSCVWQSLGGNVHY